jgi:hypothetical protein
MIGGPKIQSSESALLQALLDATRGIGIRGGYNPGGTSGAVLSQIIREIKPCMYPLSAETSTLDLDALAYALERLPKGVESCTHIDIVRDENPYGAYDQIPVPARREFGYRVSPRQMTLVVKGGKIRILDRISMITCIYIEGDKVAQYAAQNVLNWRNFERLILGNDQTDNLFIQLARITGNSVDRIREVDGSRFHGKLARVIYDMGSVALKALKDPESRISVTFSNDFLKTPIIGDISEGWVEVLEQDLIDSGYKNSPLYFISGNMKSFLGALTPIFPGKRSGDLETDYGHFETFLGENGNLADFTAQHRINNFMQTRLNPLNTGLGYQIFYLDRIAKSGIDPWLKKRLTKFGRQKAALIVMDYPFGDDAFYYMNDICKHLGRNLQATGVMGRAAVFSDAAFAAAIPSAFFRQGDPQCHVLRNNGVNQEDLEGMGLTTLQGNMLTSLGTFLQTSSILNYFTKAEHHFNVVSLEMEGIYFANALEICKLRGWIPTELANHFAYYKSDNPLNPNGTLAKQVSMGERIIPKYAVTLALLKSVLSS